MSLGEKPALSQPEVICIAVSPVVGGRPDHGWNS
jgi:hypothetical protein